MAYLIFIKANVASLVPIPGNAAVLAVLAPLLALNMLRGIAALAPFSLAADIAMIAGEDLQRALGISYDEIDPQKDKIALCGQLE